MASEIVKKIRTRIKRKEWLYEVVASKRIGKMSDRLATMLIELVKRYAGDDGRYKQLTYSGDMQAHALMILCRTWHKFKPELSDNPFAYYTQCIKGAFCNYLSKEMKEREIREALALENASKDTSYLMVDDEHHF